MEFGVIDWKSNTVPINVHNLPEKFQSTKRSEFEHGRPEFEEDFFWCLEQEDISFKVTCVDIQSDSTSKDNPPSKQHPNEIPDLPLCCTCDYGFDHISAQNLNNVKDDTTHSPFEATFSYPVEANAGSGAFQLHGSSETDEVPCFDRHQLKHVDTETIGELSGLDQYWQELQRLEHILSLSRPLPIGQQAVHRQFRFPFQDAQQADKLRLSLSLGTLFEFKKIGQHPMEILEVPVFKKITTKNQLVFGRDISQKGGKNVCFRKGRWSSKEHIDFLCGLSTEGRNWKEVAENFVKTRSASQIRSHAQKYLKKHKHGAPEPVGQPLTRTPP